MSSLYQDFRNWLEAFWEDAVAKQKAGTATISGHDLDQVSIFRIDGLIYGPIPRASIPEKYRGLLVRRAGDKEVKTL